MAGKYGPVDVFFLVDGYDLTAAKVDNVTRKVTAPQEQSDGLGDAWEEHTPVGQKRLEFSQNRAFFDTGTVGSHAAFSGNLPDNPQNTGRVICLGISGATINNQFDGMEAGYSHEYEVLAARGELQKANVTYLMSGQHDPGQILQGLAQQVADWDTETTPADYTLHTAQRVVPITSSSVANPTVITTPVAHGITNGQKVLIAGHTGSTPAVDGDHVATVTSTTTLTVPINVTIGGTGGTLVQSDSVAGGVGYLQVTEVATFTNFIAKIRDSDDDITYADLITFTDNVTAPFAERLTVAGTVDRYLAMSGDVTGSGTITAFVGFSRS